MAGARHDHRHRRRRTLARCRVWAFAVKPQNMKDVVASTRQWLRPDTLVVSVAAGIRADTLAGWLGTPEQPFRRLVRCMPNTPAWWARA